MGELELGEVADEQLFLLSELLVLVRQVPELLRELPQQRDVLAVHRLALGQPLRFGELALVLLLELT